MFIFIVLFTFVAIAFLSLLDWIKSPRFSPKTAQKKILELATTGNWEQARKELDVLLKINKGKKETTLLELMVLQGTQKYEKALCIAESASREYPEELLFRLEEGKILLKLGKAKEALDVFAVCAPIMRKESDLIALGQALQKSGYPLKCLEFIEPWMHGTQNGELIALAGDAHFELKQFGEAIRNYQRSIELGWQTHGLYLQLGHAYRRLGNLAQSEVIFKTLLEKKEFDAEAMLGLGLCLQERGEYEKALTLYQSCNLMESKHLPLLKQAGICALNIQNYPLAEKLFFELLQDKTPQNLANYGFALERQKKWQEAEQVYISLIQLFPSFPHGYRALSWMFGVGLSSTLSSEQGINYAYIALKLKNDLVSWEILSACEARVGRFNKAYQIQLSLVEHDKQQEEKTRRQNTLRHLRKEQPLDVKHVSHTLVA